MTDVATIQLCLRVTARISALLLSGAFIAPSLGKLVSSVDAAEARGTTLRSWFVVGFATSHTVHLGFVFALARALGHQFFTKFPTAGLVGGALFFVLIYLLALGALGELFHSSSRSLRALRNSRFCWAASYPLMSIFALAFVVGTLRFPTVYAPFAVMALSAMIIPLIARIRAPQARATRRANV